jgi:hypothetical protein
LSHKYLVTEVYLYHTTVALVKENASLSGPKAEPFSGRSDEPGR